MPAATTSNETYPARVRRETVYALGRARLQPLISALRGQLTARAELIDYRQFLQAPVNLEQVQRERGGRIFWVLWATLCLVALAFDTCFTFSSTAASLRDGLSRILPVVSGRLDFFVSAALAATILAITIAIRVATEAAPDRQRLNTIPADSPEVTDLVASIQRRQSVRTGWAAVLGVLLIAAALSDFLTIQAYQQIATSTSTAKSAAAPGIQESHLVSTAASSAAILALVTPYLTTFILHTLLLFLPLPASSLFLRYPCSPNRVEGHIRRVDNALRVTGRRIYDTVLAVPDETARRQLVGDLGEDERLAVNQALGRTVFQGSSGAVPTNEPTNRADAVPSNRTQGGGAPAGAGVPEPGRSESSAPVNFTDIL